MHSLVVSHHVDLPEAHLIRGLAARGVEFTVLCDPKSPNQRLLTEAGIACRPFPIASRISPRTILALRNVVRETQPDIVHYFSNRALSNGLLATRGLAVRQVAYRGTMGHLSRWDPLSWMTYLSPRLDKISCVSHAVEQYLWQVGVPRSRTVTIYKGHDPSWYETDPPADLKLFGIPDDAFVVVCAANMRPVKGVDLLLESALECANDRAMHFVFVGEVRDEKVRALAETAKGRAQVHLLGYRADATAIQAACSVSVMPSREREGLPKAVIEAMSRGIVPVVTNVGGMPELVVHEKSGLVVPSEDVAALTAALRLLRSDPDLADRLGHAARRRIEKEFNIRETIAKTHAMYLELRDLELRES